MANPLVIIEQIGKLAQASKIAAEIQKIDDQNAEGEPKPDGNPDVQQLFEAVRLFIKSFDDLQKLGVRIIKLESNLVHEISSRLEAIGEKKVK